MVIGSGLIGTAFKSYINNDDILIFASGVSNSKNEVQSNFDRELNLVNAQEGFKGLFVYFSTTSIEDVELINSKYIKHKLCIEKIVKTKFENHLIVRLPNVVGDSKNNATLVNFFRHCIINNIQFSVQKNAYRYLVDIKDVFTNVDNVIKSGEHLNRVATLITNKKISVRDIVVNIEDELNKKGNYELIEGGSNYNLQLDEIFLVPH